MPGLHDEQRHPDRVNRFTTTAGTTERLILDLRTGALGPGGAAETNQLSELEVLLNLGDASDEVVVILAATATTPSRPASGACR